MTERVSKLLRHSQLRNWSNRLHRCWWRMLETKCVGNNYEMLVTVFAIMVTIIQYLFTLALGTSIKKVSPTSKFCHQHQKIVINFKSPTSLSPVKHIRFIATRFCSSFSFNGKIRTSFMSMCLLIALNEVFPIFSELM